MIRFLFFLSVVTIITLSGCLPQNDIQWANTPLLEKELETYKTSSDTTVSLSPTFIEPASELTLRDALAFALLHNPILKSSDWSIRIAQSQELYVGLLPNPEIEFEIEEVLGTGEYSGFNATGMSIRLSQLIELGDKRAARTHVAETNTTLADRDAQTKRLAVLTDVTLGFIDVLCIQEKLRLIQNTVRLSENILKTVSERVDAGKVSPVEKIKATVELANIKIKQDKTNSKLRSARIRLTSTWSSMTPRFTKVLGNMNRIADIPDFEKVRALLYQHPEIARWTQEMQQRLAVLALEHAQRVPDLSVGVGMQRSTESSDVAFGFGIGLPLQIYDNNQGGIHQALQRLVKLKYDKKTAETHMLSALATSYEALRSSRNEVLALRNTVMPGATQAFDAVQEGYEQGKFGYLEVLDAQRTMFKTNDRILNALARYHRSVAIVESLIGLKLDSLLNQKEKE